VITFSKLGRYGRLGNQLFQISSTIGIAIKTDIDFCFPHWFCFYTNQDISKYFKNSLPYKVLNNCISINENDFTFSEIKIENKNNNFDLFGYLQSEKYFIEVRDILLNYLELNLSYQKQIEQKYNNLLNNSCSIHIRRGDYLNLQNIHPTLQISYYETAIDQIYGRDLQNINFLIFSDDIDWCKNNLKIKNSFFVDDNDQVIELILMSKCENNIIANSSFSWWGAWLNQNKNKKVVAPKNWFGSSVKLNTKDLFVNDWILI